MSRKPASWPRPRSASISSRLSPIAATRSSGRSRRDGSARRRSGSGNRRPASAGRPSPTPRRCRARTWSEAPPGSARAGWRSAWFPAPDSTSSASALQFVLVVDHHRRARRGTEPEQAHRLDRRGHDEILRLDASRQRLLELALAGEVDPEPEPPRLIDQGKRLVRLAGEEDPEVDSVSGRIDQLAGVALHLAWVDEVDRRAVLVAPPREQIGSVADLDLPVLEPGVERREARQAGVPMLTPAPRRPFPPFFPPPPPPPPPPKKNIGARRARPRSTCGWSERLRVSLPITQSSVGRPYAARPGSPSRPGPMHARQRRSRSRGARGRCGRARRATSSAEQPAVTAGAGPGSTASTRTSIGSLAALRAQERAPVARRQ